MATFKIFREFSLPNALEPYAVYLIATPDYPNHLEFYVSDSSGTSLKRLPTMQEINNLINTSIINNGSSKIEIVANITERNQLTNLLNNTLALVLDASTDPDIDVGGATYLWDVETEDWRLLTKESNLNISWEDIEGLPDSSPEEIDDAVAKRHTHTNKSIIDLISENIANQLLFRGTLPDTKWQLIEW